jgi:hypothetical protein
LSSVNYYNLLVQGPLEISDSEWKKVLKAVVYYGEAEKEPDAALDALQSILFEQSDEWIERRRRILQGAVSASSNPSRQSDYCLTSLRNLALESSREELSQQESPELPIVRRQVADHLRRLHAEKTLVTARIRSQKGNDICSVWGLASWGDKWREKAPLKDLEQVKRDLPIIMRTYAGKGIIDYATVLPSYIPMILEAYGAQLSTAQITALIVGRISPPLFSNPGTPNPGDQHEHDGIDGFMEGYTRLPSPEEALVSKQLQRSFFGILNERELQVFQLKEEGLSIDEIAERLKCSKRTINGDWKSVCDKCMKVLGQVC